jgi:hypothetical protein
VTNGFRCSANLDSASRSAFSKIRRRIHRFGHGFCSCGVSFGHPKAVDNQLVRCAVLTRRDWTFETAARVSLDEGVRAFEANMISWALKVSNGNKCRAAELLQIKRSTLGDRIVRCARSWISGK